MVGEGEEVLRLSTHGLSHRLRDLPLRHVAVQQQDGLALLSMAKGRTSCRLSAGYG